MVLRRRPLPLRSASIVVFWRRDRLNAARSWAASSDGSFDSVAPAARSLASRAFNFSLPALDTSRAWRSQKTSSDSDRARASASPSILTSRWSRRDSLDSFFAVSLMRSVLSFSWSRRVFSRAFSLSRRTTSLSSRRSSVRSDLTVSFWSGEGSRTVRRRGGAGHGPVAPSRAFDAARALRSRAFSLRSAPAVSKADAMPASERSVSRRATSACKDGTSLAVRRASFVSSTASLSLRRQALNRDFHEPPSLRAATSAQRSSSARASAASARARSRSHCDRQSRGARSGTDTGDNRTPPLPSTSVKPVPKSSSRTTMRTTIAHGKSRYQQKDSTLWGLASTWEMRLTGPNPRPERTLTRRTS